MITASSEKQNLDIDAAVAHDAFPQDPKTFDAVVGRKLAGERLCTSVLH